MIRWVDNNPGMVYVRESYWQHSSMYAGSKRCGHALVFHLSE